MRILSCNIDLSNFANSCYRTTCSFLNHSFSGRKIYVVTIGFPALFFYTNLFYRILKKVNKNLSHSDSKEKRKVTHHLVKNTPQEPLDPMRCFPFFYLNNSNQVQNFLKYVSLAGVASVWKFLETLEPSIQQDNKDQIDKKYFASIATRFIDFFSSNPINSSSEYQEEPLEHFKLLRKNILNHLEKGYEKKIDGANRTQDTEFVNALINRNADIENLTGFISKDFISSFYFFRAVESLAPQTIQSCVETFIPTFRLFFNQKLDVLIDVFPQMSPYFASLLHCCSKDRELKNTVTDEFEKMNELNEFLTKGGQSQKDIHCVKECLEKMQWHEKIEESILKEFKEDSFVSGLTTKQNDSTEKKLTPELSKISTILNLLRFTLNPKIFVKTTEPELLQTFIRKIFCFFSSKKDEEDNPYEKSIKTVQDAYQKIQNRTREECDFYTEIMFSLEKGKKLKKVEEELEKLKAILKEKMTLPFFLPSTIIEELLALFRYPKIIKYWTLKTINLFNNPEEIKTMFVDPPSLISETSQAVFPSYLSWSMEMVGGILSQITFLSNFPFNKGLNKLNKIKERTADDETFLKELIRFLPTSSSNSYT